MGSHTQADRSIAPLSDQFTLHWEKCFGYTSISYPHFHSLTCLLYDHRQTHTGTHRTGDEGGKKGVMAADNGGTPAGIGGSGGAAAPGGLRPRDDKAIPDPLISTLQRLGFLESDSPTPSRQSTEVDPHQLRKASAASADIADELDKLLKQTAERLDHGTDEHHGWETASALVQCAEAVRGRIKDQRESAEYIGSRLNGSACQYEAADEMAEQALTAIRKQLDDLY